MQLDDARESDNVEDRRGVGGGRGFRPGGVGGLGVGGLLVLLAVSYFLGVDPTQLLQDSGVNSGSGPASEAAAEPSGSDPTVVFVKRVLADTEDTWSAIFEPSGQRDSKPMLVLFSDAVDSACGQAAATGPFYCPGDQEVYLDLSFFRSSINGSAHPETLRKRTSSPTKSAITSRT